MKKLSILCALAFCGSAAFCQTLITYGANTIGKDEFLRAYNKNKPATSDKEKSLREYLELYTDFKLKVKAGQELRLDTISQIRYDMQNFRDQITENYMSDEKGVQLLTDEAAMRSAKDLHVLYFSVPVDANATPADTIKAYNAAQELYSVLKTGNIDYSNTVSAVSAKGYPVKYSDIGFISAFTAAYELENIIYNTKPGNVSMPYRTAKGWAIFKVTEERRSVGKWKAAQLLFAYPPDADYNTKLAVKVKADSVYGLLQKGLSFADAAKLYSDDRMTYLGGGELPEFGAGKYNRVFENNVFNLKNDNDITNPFETAFGYHIVKRLGQTPNPADINDASYQAEIKQKVMQDARINKEKEKFFKGITLKTGFKRSVAISNEMLYRNADTLMKNPTAQNTRLLPVSNKTIITFKDGSGVKGEEWLKFVGDYYSNPEQPKFSDAELADRFYASVTNDYYRKHLENYSNDFKYQMQEFKEGNILFEIMERNVWSKAAADSAGLKAYYNLHKENYKWTPSADVLVFNCTDEKTAQEVKSLVNTGKQWMGIAEESKGNVQADSGRYEISQLPGAALINIPEPGMFSPVFKNADGTVVILQFLKIYGEGLQRSFPEARGLVINEYQNVLERKWVQSLRNKYPVKLNEIVFKQMLN